ncbi:unnamed protein product [Euphydryas editha]|uniref:Uncharacterized protein n=1 Tax=Euphydryas editha TaxID=104508 RepID=A0AAU9UWI3_EUPED|nr:unnamed protein product [Euphydryas editha]
MKNNKPNVPSELVTTACLSGSLSIILSLTSITYCILGLIYRYECSVGNLTNRNGAEYFFATILQTYILNEKCSTANNVYNITKANSVFILAIIILVFAAVNFITAITLVSASKLEEASKNIDIVAYIHIGVSVACLVVDLTLGVHFGMDYTNLTNYLALNAPGLETNYEIDSIRIGAFLLMTLSLKGYIGHAINLILLVLLICHVVEYQNISQENEHAIHTLGVLNAFE